MQVLVQALYLQDWMACPFLVVSMSTPRFHDCGKTSSLTGIRRHPKEGPQRGCGQSARPAVVALAPDCGTVPAVSVAVVEMASWHSLILWPVKIINNSHSKGVKGHRH